ncbi:hypothetical protein CHS0354_003163 [Potamilus streckersoni]|uniref:AMP-dependent synthetase/ligase domain-containing protein n=1 Tax=Potamilus streckersoni TaxID=2493646 RepID=A0AAE0W5D2_9BIVA|nr:hypothetical protein CHS0354_003163 [Potamilus streckersoni]
MTSHKLSYLQRPLENGHLFESVPARLEYIASRFPDKKAYVFLSPGKPRMSITGIELLEKSRAIAKALVGRGIKQGDIVGISQPNNRDSLFAILENERSNSSLPPLDPDDIALLIATSGSTGESKLAAHSHRTVLMSGVHLQDSMGYTSHDVVSNERKMSWIGGFPFQYLLNGVTTVTTEYRFESLKEHCLFTYSALQQEKCNIGCLLPVTLNGLADIFRENKSKLILDNIHTGGAPISKACLGGLGEITKNVTVCYGNSEAGFLTSKPFPTSSPSLLTTRQVSRIKD